jgi:two-component system OmpR family sensor kinase/two-component system sensor histidine kinase QseC
VLLGALLGTVVTYCNVFHDLEGQFDYQLRQMALSLRDQGIDSPEDAAAIADEPMDFVVQIWSTDGLRIYWSRSSTSFPPRAVLGFSEVDTCGAALRSIPPILSIAPLLATLVWWTVGLSLAPLQRATAEAQKCVVDALEPQADAQTPLEIAT